MSAAGSAVRRAWRMLAAAAAVAYAVALACLLPLASRAGRKAIQCHWARCALRALAVRVHLPAGLPEAQGMLLANHVSWLDIIVLLAEVPSRFVAKDDVRTWPLVGWLTRRVGTLFVRRGRRSDAPRLNAELADLLAAGERVIIFPEGTTTDGSTVLPFRSALLEAAVQARVPVQPLALRYHLASGERDDTPVYIGETSLGESLWKILGAPGLHIAIAMGTEMQAQTHTRRTLALAAYAEIAALLQRMEDEAGSCSEMSLKEDA